MTTDETIETGYLFDEQLMKTDGAIDDNWCKSLEKLITIVEHWWHNWWTLMATAETINERNENTDEHRWRTDEHGWPSFWILMKTNGMTDDNWWKLMKTDEAIDNN